MANESTFYANFTSKTQPELAPDGKETGFFLVPIAPGLEDTEKLRETYYNKIMSRFETLTGQEIKNMLYLKSLFV